MYYQAYLQLKMMWRHPKIRYHILFMILLSIISIFLFIEKEYWSGVILAFTAFSIIDITKLRYQITWDYQQWLVAPVSYFKRMLLLFGNHFLDPKLMSFLLVIAFLIADGQYAACVSFVVLFACYLIQTTMLLTLSRRLAWVSVLTKLVYVFPIGISLIVMLSKFENLADFVLKWTADYRFLIAVVLYTLCLFLFCNAQLRKRPFYNEAIVTNFNKNYWY